MANSLLILYQTNLEYEKNFVIDDINVFLQNKIVYRFNDFQYQKTELDKVIRIDLQQYNLNIASRETIAEFDYARLINTDSTRPIYYFVVNKLWRGQHTIELHLKLDVLNTFHINTDYSFNDKTQTIREHRARFKRNGAGNLFRNIDRYVENINPTMFKSFTTYNKKIIDNKDINYYLIFMNQYNISNVLSNPVRMFLCADEPLLYDSGSTSLTFPNTILPNGSQFLITPNDNSSVKGTYYDNVLQKEFAIETPNEDVYYAITYFDNVLYFSTYTANGTNAFYIASNKITFTELYKVRVITGLTSFTQSDYLTLDEVNNIKLTTTLNINESGLLTKPFVNVDRTDYRLIKIIKLPYAPAETTLNGEYIQILNKNIVYNSSEQLLEFKTFNFDLTNSFTTTGSPLMILNADTITPALNQAKGNKSLESKLFNSEFYQYKYFYDNFSYAVELEKQNIPLLQDYYTDTFNIDFTTSKALASKFLFQFPLLNYGSYSQIDYDYLILVNRNNEVPIFNNAYIDYIKTGYNYDVKTKERQERLYTISNIANITGTAISFATNNYGAGANNLLSIAKNIEYIKQNEENLERKHHEKQLQSTNVSTMDDLDLFDKYSGNKLMYSIYQCSDIMRNQLYDLFYYFGYATNENKIPNINTRTYFNFVQANIVFGSTNLLSDEFKFEIVNKYANGITFIHNVNNFWDVNQELENWEVELIEE